MAHREEQKLKIYIKLILIILIKYTEAQNEYSEEKENNSNNKQNEIPLATGKWNQFKGFYTPRPIPSNAHFTFASVWASWSAWSYCTNNIQMRVRACNTVRGFSCLGPNRDIRPCENILGETINRQQGIKQIPEINTQQQQFDLEDPWAEDRREALKQLYEKQIPKKEENERVKKPELIYAAKNTKNIQINTKEGINLEKQNIEETRDNIKSYEEEIESEEEEEEEEERNEGEKEKTTIKQTTKHSIKTTFTTTPKTLLITKTTTPKLILNYKQNNQQNKLLTNESYQQTKILTNQDLQKTSNQIQNTPVNDTFRALEWMVEGISKSLEKQPNLNEKNKLLGNKNIKEKSEQNIEEEEEEEEEEEMGDFNKEKVKNRKRPLIHSGELEENEENDNIIISSTYLPQIFSTITNNYKTTFTTLPRKEIREKINKRISNC
ncbi:hypothetical protein Mgra_00007218 [Meloidogyne graminicola]|uniref:Uncharacterized protein n=1 Tax=Meloidogyne graminicola TaxID=189291 RepID=A0A8S9ZJ12_9BILA|nr:hypothetical protein Mgra_00007218 [Meloidogyne graminicola]